MLFDPVPKESRRELFDRERELGELDSFARSSSKIALVLGIRRVGKTSLLKVFVNESSYPWIFIDARKLSEYGYSKIGLYKLLSEELSRRKKLLSRITGYLKVIKGVRVLGAHVEFDWREKELSISSILEKLDEYTEDEGSPFLVIIDEAHELRFLRGYRRLDFRKIIAYCYDNLRRLKFILSGSEVGVLHEFTGFGDRESPLYGRAREVVNVEHFSRDKSLGFLEAGFSEAGVSVPRDVLERAVEVFDGIPGWLTLYGHTAVRAGSPNVVNQVVEEAVKVAVNEISNLTRHSQLYKHVLKAVAMGYRNWKNIKYFVESHTGRPGGKRRLQRVERCRCLNNNSGKYSTQSREET